MIGPCQGARHSRIEARPELVTCRILFRNLHIVQSDAQFHMPEEITAARRPFYEREVEVGTHYGHWNTGEPRA